MLWPTIKDLLSDDLPEHIFNLWIEPLKECAADDKTLQLGCPDRFFMAHFKQHYLSTIEEKLHQVSDSDHSVVLCEQRQARLDDATTKQLRLPHIPAVKSCVKSLHPRYTFDQFMVGDSNLLAQSACRSISNGDDSVGPCLYINSDTGLGKSHLTHAVAHQILAESPMTRLHYLTAQQFAAEMIREIKNNTMDRFKHKYHNQCDILLVEDIHTLAGKKKTQEELNELLDSLIKCGKRVILTAKNSPRDLNGIDSEFRSRMASGLITKIRNPDINTRCRIIKNKASNHGLDLCEETVDYIARQIRGDVRQIESAILAIRAKSEIYGEIDMALIKEAVESIVDIVRQLSPDLITEFVSKQFQISVKDMQSKSRKKIITFPRQVAMFLSRKHTSESLADIGKLFNRDHATVLHSIKVVNDLKRRDTSISAQIDLLDTKIKQIN
ncbi:MAG: chromosomal replication initiator protein DnaA [Thermodesulfobacteriota bacterium]